MVGGGDTVNDSAVGRGIVEAIIRIVIIAICDLAITHGGFYDIDVVCGVNSIAGSRTGFLLFRNPHHLIPDAVVAEGNLIQIVLALKSAIRLTGLPIIYAQLYRLPVLLVAAVVPDLPHHNPEGSFSVADVVGDRGGVVAVLIYLVLIGGVDI